MQTKYDIYEKRNQRAVKEKQDQLRWRQRRIDDLMKKMQIVQAEENKIMEEYAQVSVKYEQACELSDSEPEEPQEEEENLQVTAQNANLSQMMNIVESFEEDNST